MIRLDALAEFLDQFLAIHRFGEDPGGVYRASARPIHCLGLALEPWPELGEWVRGENLDALFLHRPWKFQPGQVGEIGVLSYHLAFDECLTLGFNPRLAIALGMSHLEPLGEKAGRPIGMFGKVPTQSFARYATWVQEVFGGDQAAGAGGEVSQVAVVGAMTDELVRHAAARGAEVYVTGQFRQPARQAVIETGIRAIAVGHRRSEEWGLRALAEVLRERWSRLEVILPDHKLIIR